jgi:hypothetical protein
MLKINETENINNEYDFKIKNRRKIHWKKHQIAFFRILKNK